jgi:hypothetical protein
MKPRKPKTTKKRSTTGVVSDPIVAGVRKVREAIARKAGYDVDRIADAIAAEAAILATSRRKTPSPSGGGGARRRPRAA